MARSKRTFDPLGYGPYPGTLIDSIKELGESMMNDPMARDAARSIDRAVARKNGKPMRPFRLLRHEDESGVSGAGVVAEGVVFSDGTVAMRWLTEYKSTAVYDSIGDLEAIHGHGGKTEVVYL